MYGEKRMENTERTVRAYIGHVGKTSMYSWTSGGEEKGEMG